MCEYCYLIANRYISSYSSFVYLSVIYYVYYKYSKTDKIQTRKNRTCKRRESYEVHNILCIV